MYYKVKRLRMRKIYQRVSSSILRREIRKQRLGENLKDGQVFQIDLYGKTVERVAFVVKFVKKHIKLHLPVEKVEKPRGYLFGRVKTRISNSQLEIIYRKRSGKVGILCKIFPPWWLLFSEYSTG